MPQYRKLLPLFWVTISLIGLNSCTDKCEVTNTYERVNSITLTLEEIRNGIKQEGPQELEKPAKIYVKDHFILISEAKKGIHILDNTDPENPVNLAFVAVPGVLDMAVKNNTLYVDSYTDVVALDITNPLSITEVGRQKHVFSSGTFDELTWQYQEGLQSIVDYNKEIVTVTSMSNCGYAYQPPVYYGYFNNFDGLALSAQGPRGPTATQGEASGKGGSMARFTLNDQYLYAVSNSTLELINIENEQSPEMSKTVELNWGIETIFPYKDNLFIGSNTAMYIFDNTDKGNPELLSVFPHSRACDPVVVQNDIAYVTLRSGGCGVTTNRLEVIDVRNLTSPRLLKTYEMDSPYGLGVFGESLFICEGENGLKSFDKTNVNDITLLQHLQGINAFDVIPLDSRILLMVGEDGFYQYDYSNPSNLKELSLIPVKKI